MTITDVANILQSQKEMIEITWAPRSVYEPGVSVSRSKSYEKSTIEQLFARSMLTIR